MGYKNTAADHQRETLRPKEGQVMDDIRPALPPKSRRFVVQFRQSVRKRGLSYGTEKTYLHWVLRYIRFHGKRHPQELDGQDVSTFLSDLAERQRCSVSTQQTALNALVFLYRHHLGVELPELQFQYARQPRRMPTVFTHSEAMLVIEQLTGVNKLIAGVLYGAGLRINEALRARVKDLDFGSQQITVRDGKGGNQRFTLLPRRLEAALKQQIQAVDKLHQYDLSRGYGEAHLPYALERKYTAAAKSLEWQFLFPASRIGMDPLTGVLRRHHRHCSVFQRAIAPAIRKAGIRRKAASHTFRHSFATRLIETGYDIKLVQSLLGHRDIRTTEIYLHVVRNRSGAIVSPLDGNMR